MTDGLARVTLPPGRLRPGRPPPSWVCAGLEYRHGRVTRAAPILGWTIGKRLIDVEHWVERNGGVFEVLAREPAVLG